MKHRSSLLLPVLFIAVTFLPKIDAAFSPQPADNNQAIPVNIPASQDIHLTGLRCEYRTDPLGIDVPHPRLSWTLESSQRGQRSVAYQILVASTRKHLDQDIGDAWDSGRVEASSTTPIFYAGVALQSDRTYYWKARVWDREGRVTAWSEPAFWTTGLLQQQDWRAKWIGLDRAVGQDRVDTLRRRLSARMLRREFVISKKIKSATAFVCGLGLFEWYLNGAKIGDQVLAPALSEYDQRAYYMTFDVTSHLKPAQNAVAVLLGNGRYFAPRFEKQTKTFGFPKLLLQINLLYEDGSRESIVSDRSWKINTDGPILANNEYDGEIYDSRKELPGWTSPGFDDSAWRHAQVVKKPGRRLCAQMIEPIKITQTLNPISLAVPQPGIYIFDMGQNMVGWAQLRVSGPRGTRVSLRFAETLRQDGTLSLDNLRTCEVTDTYILKGEGVEVWEPRFTYHGFRYVELAGFPGTPDLSTISGRVVHDDLKPAGSFACSNPLINRIYQNALWGIRGNYRSIPTDCPQRDERQGWLGDRSAESRGESFLFDVAGFYNKWLVDIQDATSADGCIPDVAPSYWPNYNDNTTWPGSYLMVAAMLYDQYHDLEAIKKHYPTMKKWIRRMQRYVKKDIMTRDVYGDWCAPPLDRTQIHTTHSERTTAGDLIGSAYFYHELRLMQFFAALLEKHQDTAEYAELAEKMKTAFNKRFLSLDPLQYGNNSQTSSILPLTFDLVPQEHRAAIMNNLVEKIMGEADGHVGTGLIGCQWLNRVLTKYNRPDIAYTLAAQNTYPSLGYMAEANATTIWELWNGDTAEAGMNSHNHVMLLGDLLSWFYEHLAGIRSDPEQPAYTHLIMKPEVCGDLEWVEAQYHSIRGPIKSKWKFKQNEFEWRIALPPNTSATIHIPADAQSVLAESGGPAAEAAGVRLLRREQDRAVFTIESGSYCFTSSHYQIAPQQPFAGTPVLSPKDTLLHHGTSLAVTITAKPADAAIHYTLDGSEPDETAALYQGPLTIASAALLQAKAYKPGFHPSAKASAVYEFIDPQNNGVTWELYEGAFVKLPDFKKRTPVKSGRAQQIDLAGLDLPVHNFAMVFSGFLEITEQDEYTFYTSSNDGSRLYINDRLIVNNDGEHGTMDKSGTVRLPAGRHRIQVTYFQSGGSKVLKVFYKRPATLRRPLPASKLFWRP
ncbi:family 78 glycoside hydrolase catalytic domain [bacterium]|nr:family 78 glycoside hydrolase catalytic domain [bacterium]